MGNEYLQRLKIGRIKFPDLILFEDDDILVVNKPKGISSLAERNQPNSGLLEMGKKHYFSELKICHRLDKMTSGVIVFAKNPDSYRSISLQFQKKRVDKTYIALVHGVHYYQNYEIDIPFTLTSKSVKVDYNEGKKAVTFITTIENYRHYTLVECKPITGKMHQIRVHLSLIKSPVVGDHEYGGSDLFLSELKKKYKMSKFQEEELSLNHSFLLHAQKIEFEHPKSGEKVTFGSELPKNFQVCLKMLKKYDS